MEYDKSPDKNDDYLLIEPVGSDKKERVSWQAIQAIYNYITGKTESLINKGELPIQVDINNLSQLNAKILQACEQYTIKQINCSVIVFHKEDRKEEYSSFERFKLYDATINSPVERIEIKYEILKTLPNVQKIQTYTILITLISGIVAEEEIKEIRKTMPNGFAALIGYYTSIVKISYVDYVVAKNYETIIDGWLKNISVFTVPEIIKFFKKYSNHLRVLIKYFILFAVIYSLIKLIPHYIIESKISSLAYFIVYGFFAIFLGYKVGDYLSYQVRLALSNYSDLTFINLNTGDEKAIKRAKKSRNKYIVKAMGSFISNLLIAFITTMVPKMLLK